MTIHIIHHRDADGYFAGAAVRDHCIKNQQPYALYDVQYGESFPIALADLKREDSIYIVDFSYNHDTLVLLSKHVGYLTVLDHHKSAQEELTRDKEDFDPACKVEIVFDTTKSGALLAWEHLNAKEPPLSCKLVNDRDLWKWEFGQDTRAFSSYLQVKSVLSNWDFWQKTIDDNAFTLGCVMEGKVFLDYEDSIIRNFTSNTRNYEICEVIVGGILCRAAVYEGMGILTSEISQAFYDNEALGVDFTVEWRKRGKNLVTFSLRSKKIDVSLIAAHHGGGGHKAAAGFTKDLKWAMDFIQMLYSSPTVAESVSEYFDFA